MTNYIKQELKKLLSFDELINEYKLKMSNSNLQYDIIRQCKYVDSKIDELLGKSISNWHSTQIINYKYSISFPIQKPPEPSEIIRRNHPDGIPNTVSREEINLSINRATIEYYKYYENKYNYIISEISKIEENRIKELKIYNENKLKEHKIYEANRLKEREIKINNIIKLSNNYINQNEAIAIITMFITESKDTLSSDTFDSRKQKFNPVDFRYLAKYFNQNDYNQLLAFQIMNKFASENKIRVEDSISVFREYMKKLN